MVCDGRFGAVMCGVQWERVGRSRRQGRWIEWEGRWFEVQCITGLIRGGLERSFFWKSDLEGVRFKGGPFPPGNGPLSPPRM